MKGKRNGAAALRLVFLLLLAALSLSCWVEAASAIASETTLCETNEESPICQRGTRIETGTAFAAVLASGQKAKIVTGATTVSCASASFKLETGEESGEPLPARVFAVNFGSCATNLGASCNVSSLVSDYDGEVAWQAGDDGTLTPKAISPGEDFNLDIACPGVSHCTYASAAPEIEIEGGEPAAFRASAVSLSLVAGSPCPATATWSGKYQSTLPNLYVQTVRETTLCGVDTTSPTCVRADRIGPFGFGAQLSSATASFEIGGTVTCTESILESELLEQSGEPLAALTGVFEFGGCEMGSTPCTVFTTRTPYASSFEWTGGDDGTFAMRSGGLGDPEVKFICGGLSCAFATGSLDIFVEGGAPGHLIADTVPLTKIDGALCAATGSFTASYESVSPATFYLEHT